MIFPFAALVLAALPQTHLGMKLEGSNDIEGLKNAEAAVVRRTFRDQEWPIRYLLKLNGWVVRVDRCEISAKPVRGSFSMEGRWICVRSAAWRSPFGFQHVLLHVLERLNFPEAANNHDQWKKLKLWETEKALLVDPR